MSAQDELGDEFVDGILAHSVEEHLNVIPEADYIKFLLPLALKVHSGETPPLGAWVQLCGSTQKGVRVLGRDGVVAFTSPALFQKVSIRINTDFGAMKTAIDEAKERGGDGATEFTRYVNHETAVLSVPKDSSHNVLAWAKVFSRYGYKMVSTTTAEAVDINKPKPGDVVTPKADLDGTEEFV